MKDTILSVIRHILTILGGIVVTKGYLGQSTTETLVGAVAALVGGAWGAIDEYRAAKTAKTNSANIDT